MSQLLDVRAGSPANTWGVSADEPRAYMAEQVVTVTNKALSDKVKAYGSGISGYEWAMLGIGVIGLMLMTKGRK